MSYAWDAFISYRRSPLVSQWTHKVFVPTLRNWLPEYHSPSPRLFLDVDENPALAGIPIGAPWQPALQDALKRSRCLIAVLSAEYFESDWCVAEFETIRKRQSKTDAQLIIPIRFADGSFYSQTARSLQHIDFEPFNTYRRPTQASRQFVSRVKSVAELLHNRLTAAPQWSASWRVVTPRKPGEKHVKKPGF
jgi:hypothetical protein